MKTFYQWLVTESEQQSFESAILQDPTERTGWLVYADWLEGQDHDPLAVRRGNVCRGVAVLLQYPTDAGVAYLQQVLSGKDGNPFATPEAATLNRYDRALLLQKLRSFFPLAVQAFERVPELQALFHPALTAEELEEHLPTGGGIYDDWQVEDGDEPEYLGDATTPPGAGNLRAWGAYQVFDGMGGSAGYVNFHVVVPKARPLDFELEINQDDIESIRDTYEEERAAAAADSSRYRDGEEPDEETDREDDEFAYGMGGEDSAVPDLDGIQEYLDSQVHEALTQMLRGA